MFTGVVVLTVLALAFHWDKIMALPAYIYLIFLAYGLLNNTMGVFFFTNAIRLVGPSRASIMSATQPLFAVTLAVIFLGEEFTVLKVVGTLAIVLGTMIIVTDKSS
jgi:drug/metabolite transporter (DMT)-like permease